MSITLVNIDEAKNHKKFWSVRVNRNIATCSWGRIGTRGQSKEFAFFSNQSARRFARDKASSKLDRGYVAIS